MSRFLQFRPLMLIGIISLGLAVQTLMPQAKQNIANLAGLFRLFPNQQFIFLQAMSADYQGNEYIAGVVALQLDDIQRAIAELGDASKSRELAHSQLLTAYDREGNWLQILESADLENTFERKLYIKNLAVHAGELSESQVQVYQANVAQFDDNLLILAQSLLSAGRFDEAISVAQSIDSEAEYVSAQVIIGRAYYYQNKLDAAIEVLHQQYVTNPQLLTQFWYGKTLYKAGQQADGLLLMERAIINAPAFHVEFAVDLAYSYASIEECVDADRIVEWAKSRASNTASRTRIDEVSGKMERYCRIKQ